MILSSFSLSLSLSLSLLRVLSFSLCLIKLFEHLKIPKSKNSFSTYSINSKRVITCMVKKSYILKAKIYINYYFFFLVSHLLLFLLLGVLLFFFNIHFYLIDITYKYNKLTKMYDYLFNYICLCIQFYLTDL